MKVFRKWWKKDRLFVKDLPTPIIKNYDKQMKLCEGVWRAALMWVLRMMLRGDSFGSIVAQVKKELGIK